MNFQESKKLPDEVGKKIIEALKTNIKNEYSTQVTQGREAYPSFSPGRSQEPEYKNYNYEYEPAQRQFPQDEYEDAQHYKHYKSYPQCNEEKQASAGATGYSEENIDMLIDLVTKLPPGVTKQTGAQIIRNTMEAMGIPMNRVLANAQAAQEGLEQDIRNNINVIEEYRAKIKNLDLEIQHFRKKAHDLENIISLFLLSENKK